MRLTLRTLLAYMDDVLDPSDQEELGRKIESSPFATELIHRSRDAVRRLRLSAPDPLADAGGDLHGGESNLDSNTSSEYLDSTLGPEAVADFERSCLEAGNNADMLLAEAASCHHILTMVLGEPAEVDADLRQRLYALAQSPAAAQQLRIEPSHATPPLASATPPIAATIALPTTPRPPRGDADEASVPDYMLAAMRQRRRGRRAIAAMVGAFVLGGGAMWYFWPQKPVEIPREVAQLGDVDDLNQEVAVGDLGSSPAASATGDTVEATADPGATAGSEAPPFTAPPTTNEPATTGETTLDATPLELPAESPPTEGPALPPPTTPATETPLLPPVVDAPAPDASEMVLGPADDAGAQPGDEMGSDAVVGTPPDTVAEATPAVEPTELAMTPSPPDGLSPPAPTAETTPAPGEAAAINAAAGPVMENDATAVTAVDPLAATPDEAPTEDPAAAVKPIGAYLGNNDVLLRLDPNQNVWLRLPPRTQLAAGEKLLSLPTFRTHVVLADANIYLSGGAEIELLPPGAGSGDAAAEFGLNIPYGQVVLNSGLNGNRISLTLADQERLVQLGPSSSLAVEVSRVFVPGAATTREPAPVEATWYLTSGSVEWNGEQVEAPATWRTADGADTTPAAIEELPHWVDREPVTDSERRARDTVAEALIPGEPVNIRLLELSDPADRGRRTEDRTLAARSGAYVGLYDALVDSLSDTNQRAAWRSQVDALRQAIARDPSAVEGIREAFALERGQDAAEDMMEMLLGFDAEAIGTNREEVKNGALVRIIRWMDDDDLAYRVLASYNFDEITGTRVFGSYRPEQNEAQRKRALNHHWQRLERGELLPKGMK